MKKKMSLCLAGLAMVVTVFGLTGCGTPATSVAASSSAAASSAESSVNPNAKVLKGTWQDTYDKVVYAAKTETDVAKRFALMHKAEDLLMSTGGLMPIYNYTDQYLLSAKVKGMAYSPMGYKLFTYASKTDGSKTIDACIASEPGTIDPALNTTVDGANYIAHCFSGLYNLVSDGKGGVTLAPGCATSYVKTSDADGTVHYDFTMRSGMKWSDGTTLDAKDFVYSWNRTASGKTGSAYAYMFDCIKNAAAVEADATGAEKLGISASDDGTHFYCTLPVETAYFLQLCAFPVYAPVQEKIVTEKDTTEAGTWATDPATYVVNGPYKVTAWAHNSMLTLEKNPYYYDAEHVTIDTIRYHLEDNDSSIYSQYQTGELDLADSFPIGEIDTIKATYTAKGEYYNMPQLGTYYYEFNVNEAAANPAGYAAIADTETKREKFRRGLSLLVDRNYIVNQITKGGQIPASSFVAAGVYDADGTTEFCKNANGGKGYYSIEDTDAAYAANVAEAIEDIKAAGFTYDTVSQKFTNVPTVKFLTNTSSGHAAIATAIQATYAQYGITFDVQPAADWNVAVAQRQAGNFECSRAGWVCDYNDPMNMLEMWLSGSGNNDCQFGKDASASYTGYSVDVTGLMD
ncbi:MAG: ABC transporter substrate-binding protein [Bacilli bacterium]|jgi:oligopeptide transport system substrate-binding protein|nr:ABC transporter substrate-binding protein [Bacilli bacterium]